MSDSRTRNTKRNIISGLIYRFLSMLLPFFVRTAMIYLMGEYYTGLSSLFSSILQVLNLAELGFSSAIVYNMYKPLADNDVDTVCALLNYYRKIYVVIGSFILVVGCAIMPWIPMLINGEYPKDVNIYVLYLLYLTNASVSYWLFAYKSSLLTALQRVDIENKIYSFTLILSNVLHLLVLIITRNIYIYVVVTIFTTVLNNLMIQFVSKKYYSQYLCKGTLTIGLKKRIKKQVAGIMVEKLGDTSRNSFDSIILSTFLGLSVVTVYSNYYYVFSSVYAVILIVTRSMTASIGDSVASESVEKNYEDFKKFSFIFSLVVCFCCTCMFCLYQPFMKLWVGGKLMFSFEEMSLFCIYFWILTANCIPQVYFSTNGLWWKAKLYTMCEAIGNLLLNIILGNIFGVKGVLLATIFTIFFLQFIPRTRVTFNNYFKKSPSKFYIVSIMYGLVTVLAASISYVLCNLITLDGPVELLFKLCVCTIVAPSFFLLAFINSSVEKDAIVFLKLRLLSKNK